MSDTKNGDDGLNGVVFSVNSEFARLCCERWAWRQFVSGNTNQPQKTDYDFIMEVLKAKISTLWQSEMSWDFQFLSSGAVEEKTTFGPGRPQGNDGIHFGPFFCRHFFVKCARRTFWQLRQFQTLCGTLMWFFCRLRVSFTSNESLWSVWTPRWEVPWDHEGWTRWWWALTGTEEKKPVSLVGLVALGWNIEDFKSCFQSLMQFFSMNGQTWTFSCGCFGMRRYLYFKLVQRLSPQWEENTKAQSCNSAGDLHWD